MLENAGRAIAAPNPPPQPIGVEFYTVELSPLADGMIAVSLLATVFDDEELGLSHCELGTNRVHTIDDALAFVKTHVQFS